VQERGNKVDEGMVVHRKMSHEAGRDFRRELKPFWSEEAGPLGWRWIATGLGEEEGGGKGLGLRGLRDDCRSSGVDAPKILSRASEYAFSRKLMLRLEEEAESAVGRCLVSPFGRFRIVSFAFPNIVSCTNGRFAVTAECAAFAGSTTYCGF